MPSKTPGKITTLKPPLRGEEANEAHGWLAAPLYRTGAKRNRPVRSGARVKRTVQLPPSAESVQEKTEDDSPRIKSYP